MKKSHADSRKRPIDEVHSSLKSITEASDEAIISTSPDGIILDWNRGAETIYGYSAAEAIGQSIFMLLPPDLTDEAPWITERLKKGEGIGHHETTRLRKDGSRVEVSLTISPVRDAKGTIVAISRTNRAVPTAKETEEKLQEYRRVVEDSQDMIAVVDRDYRYVLVNNTFLQYRGVDRKEVIGRSAEDVLGRDVFNATVKQHLDACFQGNPVQFEMKYTYAGLGERKLLVTYFPVEESGHVNRVATVIKDVTEQRKAEEAIRQSEEMFRLTFDQSPVGAALVDVKDGHFLRVNGVLCRFLGYTEEELRQLMAADVSHPDDMPPTRQQMRLLRGGELDGFDIEKRYISKNGAVVWGRTSVQAVRDASGGLLHALVMIQDITTRKQAYLALQESEEMFRLTFDQSPVGAALVDVKDGHFSRVNESLCRFLGYTKEELVRPRLPASPTRTT